MIAHAENILKSDKESFFVGEYSDKWFERSWHYHAEFELLYITEGFGVRAVGNVTSSFEKGDLVLIGGNIPHAWFSDDVFFTENSDLKCSSVYAQFDRAIFGTRFASSPEMHDVMNLLNEARYGLKYMGNTSEFSSLLQNMLESQGLDRLLKLIRLLMMFKQGDYEPILNDDYFANSIIPKSVRIRRINDFVLNNYMKDIKLEEVAAMVEMNESAFCRFFKKMTGKTLSQYVKEVRIDYAQQMLINTNLPSNIIGFECGFSSVAYFNQTFKSLTGISPLAYRKANS